MAAYRFYGNPRMSVKKTFEPVKVLGKEAINSCDQWALVIDDWSPLHYTHHESKEDRIVLYNKNDFGYLLQTALLISDKDGAPLVPLYLGVEASDGVHNTRSEKVLPRRGEMDGLNRVMGYLENQDLGLPMVHIVDREADSLLHMRRFERCQRKFVIRGNNVRKVEHDGQERLLSEVESVIEENLRFTRLVEYKGINARQYVAETEVWLKNPVRQRRIRDGKLVHKTIHGRGLKLRLIIAQVRDAHGKVLATWRLWSNLPESVNAETIAQWYYWRWRIESYFKLLKGAGQHLEHWQQETARAIAKRLVVAAQACVIIWAMMKSSDAEVAMLRRTLMRLSGRLMKYKVEYTAPALLTGVWNLMMILDALDQYPIEELKQMGNVLKKMLGLRALYT